MVRIHINENANAEVVPHTPSQALQTIPDTTAGTNTPTHHLGPAPPYPTSPPYSSTPHLGPAPPYPTSPPYPSYQNAQYSPVYIYSPMGANRFQANQAFPPPPGLTEDSFSLAYLLACITCCLFVQLFGLIAFFLAVRGKMLMQEGQFEKARRYLFYSTTTSLTGIAIGAFIGGMFILVMMKNMDDLKRKLSSITTTITPPTNATLQASF